MKIANGQREYSFHRIPRRLKILLRVPELLGTCRPAGLGKKIILETEDRLYSIDDVKHEIAGRLHPDFSAGMAKQYLSRGYRIEKCENVVIRFRFLAEAA